MSRTLAAIALLGFISGSCAFGAGIGPDRKLIEWGWDQPDTAYLREHIADMERTPFNGVIFGVRAWTKDGPVYFSHENWGARRFTAEELRPAMEDMRATRFARFTDNFLRLNVTPGNVDWFDPKFEAVIGNTRLAAKVAAAGRVRGFMFDVEMYQSPVFTYRGQKYSAEKSFDEYAAQVRARGREFMSAIQGEVEAPVVMLTFGPSLIHQAPQARLEDIGYGLLPAFVDGMLEAAGPHTVIVDGYEGAYPFRDVAQFSAARRAFAEAGRKFSKRPRLYRERMRLAFGLWMDQGWRSVGWFPDDPEKNQISPLEFEYALHRALAETDKYVWVYSEQPNWYTRDKLPPGYVRAVRSARRPHDPKWRTSRDLPGGATPPVTAASQPGYDDETTFAPLWSKYEKIIDLPKQCIFRLDRRRVGEQERWFASDADESSWKPIEIGKFWEEQGYQDYDGVGWYRVRVTAPAAAEGRRLLLAFGAADETAKVWVNGQAAGEWGLLGFTWHERFEIDVTPHLRTGEDNLIVVRVEDSIGMGGLWKSVLLISPKRH
ncbi:MAG: hypothetical protein JSV65_16880 [Armatimonadota bacterium]|nr:MAG: hypothetical protein JSV65_16880 [Armatimonadota bacterium]